MNVERLTPLADEEVMTHEATYGAEPMEILKDHPLSDDPVKDYLRSIGRVPLLDKEQEVDLSKRIEAGKYAAHLLALPEFEDGAYTTDELEWLAQDGDEAKEYFIEANTRLVVSIAKRYAGRGLNFIDLIQEGNLGLIRAVEKFDYTKGYRFSTYATQWIRHFTSNGLADKTRNIRIPTGVHDEVVTMRTTASDLEGQGIQATPEALAAEMGVGLDRILDLKQWDQDTVSLDAPLGGEGDGTIGSLIGEAVDAAGDEAVFNEMRNKLVDAIEMLGERDQTILMMRYGLGDGKTSTLKEIAGVVGVSPQRVSQLVEVAVTKLAEHKELEQYVTIESAS